MNFIPVSDELQIRNLVARYALLTDAGEADAFADLFVDDCSWTRENAPPITKGGSGLSQEKLRGRDAMAKLIVDASINRFNRLARHQMTDLLVEPGDTPDIAKLVFRALVTNWQEGPGRVAMHVHYQATCVRTDAGWRFKDVSAGILPR